jgi:hypothetical protein
MIEVPLAPTHVESHTIPDWLKPVKDDSASIVMQAPLVIDPLIEETPIAQSEISVLSDSSIIPEEESILSL